MYIYKLTFYIKGILLIPAVLCALPKCASVIFQTVETSE